MAFVKLFTSILDSTVWHEPEKTRIVWITLLAMSDRNGDVSSSILGLASRARVDINSVHDALNTFLSADLHSRTKDFEGRRIEEIDGGWHLLNYEKYRQRDNPEYLREKSAERQRRFRERLSRDKTLQSVTIVTVTPSNAIAEADADAERKQTHVASAAPRCSFAPFTSELQQRNFEEFWKFYWRRVAKAKAAVSYAKAVPSLPMHRIVMDALSAQSVEMLRRDPDKRPHAASWLNQQRWNDETDTPAQGKLAQSLEDLSLEDFG